MSFRAARLIGALHRFSTRAVHARAMGPRANERVAVVTEMRTCALQPAAACVEPCPAAACPFWEEGGAVLDAGCALERLSLDLPRRPGLVRQLLEVRLGLDPVRPRGVDARSVLYRLCR